MKCVRRTLSFAASLCIALTVSCSEQPVQPVRPLYPDHAPPETQPAGPPMFRGNVTGDWESFQAMHVYYLDRFVRSDGFGIGRIVDWRGEPRYWRLNVAGIHFGVKEIQLVSLNGGKDPFAYVVDYDIPQKKRLAQTKRRPLTQTESDALDRLKAGEDIVWTESGDKPVLLGAVRATASCIKCHEAPEGTLLGAFNYRLQDMSENQQRSR